MNIIDEIRRFIHSNCRRITVGALDFKIHLCNVLFSMVIVSLAQKRMAEREKGRKV